MVGKDDPRDLPLDPSDWERTELYEEDDPALAEVLQAARALTAEGEPVDVSEVTMAPQRPRRWRAVAWVAATLALGVGALVAVDRLATDRPAARDATDAGDDATPDIPADFTAAFRRGQDAVQRCLDTHADDAGDAERLFLLLDIGADGAVDRAQLTPDAIATTELGACLVAVARDTRFAASEQPTRVRIPIALHRR